MWYQIPGYISEYFDQKVNILIMAEVLHSDMFYKIMASGLETRDVVRCMQVCKSWKVLSYDRY